VTIVEARMDETVRSAISRIYINREDNHAMNAEIVGRMKTDLARILGGIEDISVNTQVAPHDAEYERIDYGKMCPVALDIIISSPRSRHTMVVQISKLGKFAQYYWRKGAWLGLGGMSYRYTAPKDWPEALLTQICQAIEALKVRILGDKELSEEVKAIPSWCMGPEVGNETVRGLLFCFDGPH
jgi:hypothetical protein